MRNKFDLFVILAGMRTGSNLLESNLDQVPGVTCFGEAFNPGFVGYPNRDAPFGINLLDREKDPHSLLALMRTKAEGLGGFRFFHDHDPRILSACLADKRCAKIVLTRNPVESYVSWKIARETGQWKLTNAKHRKTAKVRFDPKEFCHHAAVQAQFQRTIRRSLQTKGQVPFGIDYSELLDVDLLNGLLRFMGVDGSLSSPATTLKKQNPGSLRDLVENFEVLESTIAGTADVDLSAAPDLEPARAPMVRSYFVTLNRPMIFMPIPGGPTESVRQWLADVDGVDKADLKTGFSQKDLRKWKRQNANHRSLTVVCHPVERAHRVFCKKILDQSDDSFADIRGRLRKVHGLPIPEAEPDASYSIQDHRHAFAAFVAFLKSNLNGQTGIRVDKNWASQAQIVQGFSTFASPDHILRAERLTDELAVVADLRGGHQDAAPVVRPCTDEPYSLADIYDGDIETAVRVAYQRDYMVFGYRGWVPGNQAA